jgi:hypothetical protein
MALSNAVVAEPAMRLAVAAASSARRRRLPQKAFHE